MIPVLAVVTPYEMVADLLEEAVSGAGYRMVRVPPDACLRSALNALAPAIVCWDLRCRAALTPAVIEDLAGLAIALVLFSGSYRAAELRRHALANRMPYFTWPVTADAFAAIVRMACSEPVRLKASRAGVWPATPQPAVRPTATQQPSA